VGRKPVTEAGFLISIMVDDIEETINLIVKHDGTIVQPLGMDAPELTAHFTDPAGNVLGLYQHRG
jgi:predicted enzyme related to lactoylglutathione lyase